MASSNRWNFFTLKNKEMSNNYNLQTDEVLQCFDDHRTDHHVNLICIECNQRYDALLNLFKDLQGAGKILL